jgi:hypothetical protein
MRLFTVLALALAIGLATAASPFASSRPDGLERVAADKGFIDEGRERGGPVAGYAIPGIGDERLATGLAGFTGTLLVFALGYGVAAAARRRPLRA